MKPPGWILGISCCRFMLYLKFEKLFGCAYCKYYLQGIVVVLDYHDMQLNQVSIFNLFGIVRQFQVEINLGPNACYIAVESYHAVHQTTLPPRPDYCPPLILINLNVVLTTVMTTLGVGRVSIWHRGDNLLKNLYPRTY